MGVFGTAIIVRAALAFRFTTEPIGLKRSRKIGNEIEKPQDSFVNSDGSARLFGNAA